MTENNSEAIQNRKITRNIAVVMIAQIISLLVSVVVSFLVPKCIDEYQYAYWQTYVLYSGYVGVLHFGLLDGIILRYSQYDFDELNKNTIRSQFGILLISTSVIAVLIVLFALFFLEGIWQQIVILLSVSVITKNINTYNANSFQMTNRMGNYATLSIVQRAVFGLMVLALIMFDVNSFKWFCIVDLIGDFVGIFLSSRMNKGMYFGETIPLKESLREWTVNLKTGMILLLSNWSAMFLLGGAKMVVQWNWDELVFGKVSFAFSVSNLFLTFIAAISVVLFPSLKRMDEDKLPELYKKIRGLISPFLFFMMLFYFPARYLLGLFLPAYVASLEYLGILLPIIIYSSKVNLLTNNYLKAYRKEKSMLWVNIVSLVLAAIAFAISAYLLNNLKILLICIVGAVMLNSILSEIVVMKTIKIKFVKEFFVEGVMTIAFILVTDSFSLWMACFLYFIILAVYFIYERNNVAAIFNQIKNLFNRRTKE